MKVVCPHCSQKYNISKNLFGTEIKCKVCEETIVFYEKDVIAKEIADSEKGKKDIKSETVKKTPNDESLEKISKTDSKKGSKAVKARKGEKPKLVTSTDSSFTLDATSSNRSQVDASSKKNYAVLVKAIVLVSILGGFAYVYIERINKEKASLSNHVVENTEKEDPESAILHSEQSSQLVEDQAEQVEDAVDEGLLRRRERRRAKRERALLASNEFEKEIVPILQRTCMDCHDEISEEGDLNLEQYLVHQEAELQPDLWEKVAKVVSLNQMPPSDRKKQLTDEDKEKLQNWAVTLSQKWENGEMGSDPGKTIIHRLNKYEYSYTVRDLFGLKFWAAGDFPEDGSGESGFSNTADALFLPTLLAENYFEVAQKIVESVYANSESRSRYLLALPVGNKKPDQAAEEIIKHWATFIYRKPADEKELERLITIFQSEFAKDRNFREAMKMPLFGMLISPNFLYRSTIPENGEGVNRLSEFELASKLSYFLWSSMPDKELFRLAQQGKLSDNEVLEAQTKRMLADDRAKSLGKHLGGQWFGWEDLRAAVNPDEKKFPEFNYNLRVGLYQESSMFFNHLVKSDGSIYDLLDSDYTFLNSRLANFYNLPPVEGNNLRLVKLEDRNRGGVLGMGSVLTSTSLALRSSPSNRGAYVLRDVLGIPLPEPPMDVEPLPADDKDLGQLSIRESLEEHRTNPDCRSCHSEIDPIGFGLEAFDAIGRFRTHQNGVEIDVSGKMPDGTEFSSPAELKSALLKNKELFARNAAEKFLTYGLGRELTPYDRPIIKQISDRIIENNGSVHTGIIEVVKSYPFRNYRGDRFQPIKPNITAK